MASNSRRDEFASRGYLHLPAFFSRDEIAEVHEEIRKAQPLDPDNTRLNKGELIFYHNLFYRNPSLQRFIAQPKIIHLLRDVIGPDFWVRWDQAVLKRPGGAEFPWHQDNGYNRLKDGHYQLWIALTDMKVENGGLWLQPGSHQHGVRPHKLVENHLVCPGNPEQAISVEAQAGDTILFSSLMLHYTSPNTTDLFRWAYVVEYMSLDHHDPYIKPPYFVVSRNGEPHAEFVRSHRGSTSLGNRMKYLGPKMKMKVGRRLRRLRSKLRGSATTSEKPDPNETRERRIRSAG